MESMNTTKMDPRKVFAETMLDVGESNTKVLGVSCDSASGGGLGDFVKAFPERYVELGISEQNAIGVSAGLAKQGFIPVVVAITPFVTMRCYEQIRNDIGYSNMNVKIVGSGAGLAYSTLGSTHEALEDMSLMRSIPNMTILSPGDGYEVEMSLRMAVEHKGPVYIRMPRQGLEDILRTEKQPFQIGKAEVIEQGSDIAIFACGRMTREAQKAAYILRDKGIEAAVVNFHTVKPIDSEVVSSFYAASKMVVSVEEHSVTGGLGTAVAEIIAKMKKAIPFVAMGVPEGSVNTGPFEEILDFYSLTGEKIAQGIYESYTAL